MFTDIDIFEASALTDLADPSGARYRVRLIEANKLGSSGYYSEELLRNYGPKIFKAGTPMHLDHQMKGERTERPFGSVSTFAAELATDAVFENDGLYADITVFEHVRPMIKSLWDKIGVSIRAKGKAVLDVIEGRKVPVFTELTEAYSVDFVTRAGAGGKLVSILESETTTDEDNMEEVLAKLDELKAELVAKMEAAVESATKAPEAPAAEKVIDVERTLAVAEALAGSKLNAEGRKRVAALAAADGADISALIEAEEAYIASAQEAASGSDEEFGAEEGDSGAPKAPVELKLPGAWTKKDN